MNAKFITLALFLLSDFTFIVTTANAAMYKCKTPRGVEYQQIPCSTESESKEIQGNIVVLPEYFKEGKNNARTLNEDKSSHSQEAGVSKKPNESQSDNKDKTTQSTSAKSDTNNINKLDNNGFTDLMTASLNNRLDVVQDLLNKGADVNTRGKEGLTALMLASQKGNFSIVQLLLDKKADVNIKTTNDGATALIYASQDGYFDVVKALLDKNANVNERGEDGTTALMLASLGGHLNIVQALLDKGADVNEKNKSGSTALLYASQNGYLPEGNLVRSGYVDTTLALLNKGADINIKDENGATALIFASHYGYLNVVQALLDKGADVNIKTVDGVTALVRASVGNHPEIVQALLKKGADEDVNTKNNTAKNVASNAHAAGEFEPEMVTITGGCFQMGSPVNEPNRRSDENQHQVCVKGFEIGRYEVTQRQWLAAARMGGELSRFMSGHPSQFECLDCPVEMVAFYHAQNYIKILNQQTGKKYRLPTEAEWEYACRGGVAGQRFCGGDEVYRVAWYEGNSESKTHPVGQKAANGFELYDMSGNVKEWTCSAKQGDYNGAEKECKDDDMASRVASRGGGWNSTPAVVRSAFRYGGDPAGSSNDQGFRLAR